MTVFLSRSLLSKRVVENKMARRQRSRKTRQPRQTILMVTNGRVTEYMYLKELGKRAQLSIKVKMINGEPETLVRELQNPRAILQVIQRYGLSLMRTGQTAQAFLLPARKPRPRSSPGMGSYLGLVLRCGSLRTMNKCIGTAPSRMPNGISRESPIQRRRNFLKIFPTTKQLQR